MTNDLVVTTDSNGDFLCPVCGMSYQREILAEECISSHTGDKDALIHSKVRALTEPLRAKFGDYSGASNTMGTNEQLVALMFEDYLLSREHDIVSRGKVGPMTMQLSKNLNEAMGNLNKLKYGTKSLSVSQKLDTPDDVMTIIKEIKGDD